MRTCTLSSLLWLATNLTEIVSTSRMNGGRIPQSSGLGNEPRMKSKALTAAILCLLPLPAAAQTADEIVNKAVAARGGPEKIKAIQSERVTGRVAFGPGLEGTLVAELKRPHKLHVELEIE